MEKVVRKKWKGEAKNIMIDFVNSVVDHSTLAAEQFQEALNASAEKNNSGAGSVMQLLRVAVTGEEGGPDLMKIMEIIGTQETSSRINSAITEFDKITAE